MGMRRCCGQRIHHRERVFTTHLQFAWGHSNMDRSDGPKVVALLENNPYPFDIRARLNAVALAEAGYQMTVIAPRGRNQKWSERVGDVQVYRFPVFGSGTGLLNYLAEFLSSTVIMTAMVLWVWARHGLDILHMYSPPDNLSVSGLLPKWASKAIVYDNRDLSPELYESKFGRSGGFLWRLLCWLERRATRLATHVLVVNESYRRVIIERDGVPPERVTAVRIGPELDRLRPAEPDAELRSRAGTIIVYLGQMSRQDGVDHLLRALRHLKDDLGRHDWYCVLIGRADNREDLDALVTELGIGERVWFTGYVPDPDMLRYLSTADICVDPDPANPLNEISTMIKLMEYLTLGKPVVAYDLTEHRVTAGEAALYAKPNDEMHMAQQIARLMDEPALRARLGSLGRQRAEKELAWDHQRGKLLAVYDQLIQRDAVRRHDRGVAS